MSCCYVLFEPRAGRLHYANAGHPYPYLYRAGEGFLHRLEALDPILGALDVGAGGYAERTLPWEPGDVLVMYTDGVTEARDIEGRMFEHASLEACIAETGTDSAEDLRDRILARISEHAGGGLQDDDLTLVIARAH